MKRSSTSTTSKRRSAFAPAVGVKSTTTPPPSRARGGTPSANGAPSASPRLRKGLVHILSGGVSAGLVRASLQPLDTVKTRLQASNRVPILSGGLRGLYRGVIPGVIGIVPAAAVYMLAFQTLRARLLRAMPRRRNVAVGTAAGVANVAAALVRVPCEVVKQRIQVGQFSNVAGAVASVCRRGGGAYAGMSAQLMRDVPQAAAEFVMYERLGGGGIAGGVAGAFAAFVSNPMDVVKTRLMTQTGVHYRSVRHAFWLLLREEGASAFVKGAAPRVAAKTLQSAMFFATYEALRRAFAAALRVETAGV